MKEKHENVYKTHKTKTCFWEEQTIEEPQVRLARELEHGFLDVRAERSIVTVESYGHPKDKKILGATSYQLIQLQWNGKNSLKNIFYRSQQ